ncbi:MAG: hypothetical protein QM689_03370 [Oscillospiraceae bacterium]
MGGNEGEVLRVAFWVKCYGTGSAFQLEISPPDWDKRATWRLTGTTPLLIGEKNGYRLYAADYTVKESGSFGISISVNDFEVEVFPAMEDEVQRFSEQSAD